MKVMRTWHGLMVSVRYHGSATHEVFMVMGRLSQQIKLLPLPLFQLYYLAVHFAGLHLRLHSLVSYSYFLKNCRQSENMATADGMAKMIVRTDPRRGSLEPNDLRHSGS